MPSKPGPVEALTINVVRGLAMDAPQKANSGHSGTAMALAPLGFVLFDRVMNYDPKWPSWPDRDRFVLSAGHASILLYSYLYLYGFGLELDDLKNFRQWASLTPGHPEAGHTKGVEVTTGPLGQGVGNGVGVGLAERYLRSKFSSEICNHFTFVIAGDGCMQEGISHEAASLAGHLGLGRLIYVYDDNHITIDGPTELAYDDNRAQRFEAYGWHVNDIGESANDLDKLETALREAMDVEDRPSIIILRSHIGWPSPTKTDTKEAHGEPFGAEEIEKTKVILGLDPAKDFWVPEEVLDYTRRKIQDGAAKSKSWTSRFASWEKSNQKLAGQWDIAWNQSKEVVARATMPSYSPGDKLATRQAMKKALNVLAQEIPTILSGGADLTGNTGVALDNDTLQAKDNLTGRQIAYGIREHAMGAVMNGLALHGGVFPVGGTFFVFSDYMKPAIRLASLSKANVVYSFTHDSIGLGEDGPTHQPVEHLAALRAVPGLLVIRPADANETNQALQVAFLHEGPVALILSRQAVPVLDIPGDYSTGLLKYGAYSIYESNPVEKSQSRNLDLVLIATGSEVAPSIEAAKILELQSIKVRVVSMPSWNLFEDQSTEYRNSVLPTDVPTISVEAASSFGWARYAPTHIAIDRFGASAPGATNMDKFGFSADNIAQIAAETLKNGDVAQ